MSNKRKINLVFQRDVNGELIVYAAQKGATIPIGEHYRNVTKAIEKIAASAGRTTADYSAFVIPLRN
jgi:hypothetical protein